MSRLGDVLVRPSQGARNNAREAAAAIALAVADRRAGRVGRFAYVTRPGVPDIVPVDYLLDGDDIFIRSGPGPKLQAAERQEFVALEVDDLDAVSTTARSVVVIGRAVRIAWSEEQELEERLAGMSWVAGPRRHVIRIRPTRVTGRQLS